MHWKLRCNVYNSSWENTMFSLSHGSSYGRCNMRYSRNHSASCTDGCCSPVTEAMKILVGDYESLRGTMFSFDIWNNQYLSLKVNRQKKSTCPSCGKSRTYPSLTFETQMKTEVLCGRNTVQIRSGIKRDLNLTEIQNDYKKCTCQKRRTYYHF